MNEVMRRLQRLERLEAANREDVPPEDSFAFQIMLCWLEIFGADAVECLAAHMRGAILAMDPLEWEEGYSRDLVITAQRIITEAGRLEE